MSSRIICSLSLSWFALFSSCSERTLTVKEQIVAFDEADLNRWLVPGLTKAEVAKRLGPPVRNDVKPDGSVLLEFESSHIKLNRVGSGDDFRVYGIRAFFRDNKLARWLPNYRSFDASGSPPDLNTSAHGGNQRKPGPTSVPFGIRGSGNRLHLSVAVEVCGHEIFCSHEFASRSRLGTV